MTTPSATKTAGDVRWRSQTQNKTIGESRETAPRPIVGGIYVHVPFCRHKCPYCHFYVIPYSDEKVSDLLQGLFLEYELRKDDLDKITSLYIGGGTPSLLSPHQLETLLAIFPNVDGEITMEANPEDVTLEKMEGFRKAGVNRLSIGVQTLDEGLLQFIDRRHTNNRAIEAVETAAKAGFDNISIDLMYDLPTQTRLAFQRSLRKAISLPITHLSLYNLTFEPGSKYFQQKEKLLSSLPADEESLQMIEDAVEILEEGGFKRYEISAFAKPGYEAQHNSSYWLGRPFLGLGPSAFSYTYGRRHKNASHISKWLSILKRGEDPVEFIERLPAPDNYLELLSIRLRLLEGANLEDFPPLPTKTQDDLTQLSQEGFLKKKGSRFSLTKKGTLFYDTVASTLIA